MCRLLERFPCVARLALAACSLLSASCAMVGEETAGFEGGPAAALNEAHGRPDFVYVDTEPLAQSGPGFSGSCDGPRELPNGARCRVRPVAPSDSSLLLRMERRTFLVSRQRRCSTRPVSTRTSRRRAGRAPPRRQGTLSAHPASSVGQFFPTRGAPRIGESRA